MTTKENPNAFKHQLNHDLVKKMAKAITLQTKKFDSAKFIGLHKNIHTLELKARVQLISQSLAQCLPVSYPQALKIILATCQKPKLKPKLKVKLAGFELWPFTEFIQTYGLDHFKISMDALSKLTVLFTAEFAVRPFFVKYEKASYSYLLKQTESKNVHLRRWASEGSRPLLPWGLKLQNAVKNPKSGLQILDKLKFDQELYVRKSVANHLNDISKSRPDLVVATLNRWLKTCPKQHKKSILWIQHQALRTLIKKGHTSALKSIGYGETPRVQIPNLILNQSTFKIGEILHFKFNVQSKSLKTQNLVIDYSVHFKKSNGKNSEKVFKLKKMSLKPKENISIEKKHSLKQITTRVYYSGVHFIEIQINGKKWIKKSWSLSV